MFVYSAVVKCPIAGSQWREYGKNAQPNLSIRREGEKAFICFWVFFFTADGEAHLGFNICFIVSPYAEHLV